MTNPSHPLSVRQIHPIKHLPTPNPPALPNWNSGLSKRFRFIPCPSHCYWSHLRQQWSQAKAEKLASRQTSNTVYCPQLLGGPLVLPKGTKTLLPGTFISCLDKGWKLTKQVILTEGNQCFGEGYYMHLFKHVMESQHVSINCALSKFAWW